MTRDGRPLVVVGDALLDVDLVGSASRLTPDAPVPVVEDVERRERPDVESSSSTSPGRPCASTCRANSSSAA